jgi:hypothetical protein
MPIPLLTQITLELVRRMARLYLRGIRSRPNAQEDESQIGGSEDEDQQLEPKEKPKRGDKDDWN